jgi:hypothetical protein
MREAAGGCVCGIAKGWICAPPESDRAHSGWTEHGICEMHEEVMREKGCEYCGWIDVNPKCPACQGIERYQSNTEAKS